jgi:hypothetical protein
MFGLPLGRYRNIRNRGNGQRSKIPRSNGRFADYQLDVTYCYGYPSQAGDFAYTPLQMPFGEGHIPAIIYLDNGIAKQKTQADRTAAIPRMKLSTQMQCQSAEDKQ